MKKLIYFYVLFGAISANVALAQYQLAEKDGDRSALYFNTKLSNAQGVIYTTLFENFSSPQKITTFDIPIKDKGDLYSSESQTLRLRCVDKAISIVDGRKFLDQNMQGGMVSYQKPLSEKEVKWAKLEEKYSSQEPYRSMLIPCK